MEIERWNVSDDGKCFLCGKPDADYQTHVIVDGAGHLRVDVHMQCLIEKGSTNWKSDDTPQITARIHKAIMQHDPLVCTAMYIQDDVRFSNDFPELRKEIKDIAALIERASNHWVVMHPNIIVGAFIWHSILRPVDYLVTLRKLKSQVESENPWAFMDQDSLL